MKRHGRIARTFTFIASPATDICLRRKKTSSPLASFVWIGPILGKRPGRDRRKLLLPARDVSANRRRSPNSPLSQLSKRRYKRFVTRLIGFDCVVWYFRSSRR